MPTSPDRNDPGVPSASEPTAMQWLARATFMAAALLVIGAGVLAMVRFAAARRAGEWVEHTSKVLDAVHDIRTRVDAIHSAKHGALQSAPEPADSDHTLRALAALAYGRALTRDDPRQQEELDTLEKMTRDELSELARTVGLVQRGQNDSARDVVRDAESEQRADLLARHLRRLTANEHELLRQRTALQERHAGLGRMYVLLGLVAGVLLALAGGYLIRVGEQRAGRSATAAKRAAVDARRSESRFRAALDTMLDPFYIARPVDGAGPVEFEVVEANAAGAELAGVTRSGLLGARLGAVFPDGGTPPLTGICRDVVETRTRHAGEYRLEPLDGVERWIRLQVAAMEEGVAVACNDITNNKRVEAALTALAVRDELTGLLNRRGFRQLAEHEMLVARRAGRGDAVLSLDLNGFKSINDTFGHAEGDTALREVAGLLRSALREIDVIARFGGDEFVVYTPGAEGSDNVSLIAARLSEALITANGRARAGGRPYDLAAGIGVAMLGAGETLDAVLARADADLYAKKRNRA